MIDVDGLKIERNQYGQVVVTLPDGSTAIDGSVQSLLLYEILANLSKPPLVQLPTELMQFTSPDYGKNLADEIASKTKMEEIRDYSRKLSEEAVRQEDAEIMGIPKKGKRGRK